MPEDIGYQWDAVVEWFMNQTGKNSGQAASYAESNLTPARVKALKAAPRTPAAPATVKSSQRELMQRYSSE